MTLSAPIPEYLPPKQLEGESAADYIARCEWHRSRIPAEILHAPIKGYVAGSDGMQPWQKADIIGPAGRTHEVARAAGEDVLDINTVVGELSDQRKNARVFDEAEVPVNVVFYRPKIRKRSGAERIAEVRQGLFSLAVASYTDGVMRLPRSICEKLVRLGVYTTLEDAQAANVEETMKAFELYAKTLLEHVPTSDLTPIVGRSPAQAAV